MNPDSDPRTVLVVEDEAKIARLLLDYLQAAGFGAHWLARGDAVIESVRREPPDLILLDVMLPGTDGLTLCRELRGFTTVPIIMLTARVEEIDRLLGLELGADDYICKPFSPREVVARVRAILRRLERRADDPGAGGFEVDPERMAISLDGQILELTRTEYRLLAALAGQPGRVFSRDNLLDRLGDEFRDVSDRAVDSHIKNLRRKLAAIRPGQTLIHSIYGVGYKLET